MLVSPQPQARGPSPGEFAQRLVHVTRAPLTNSLPRLQDMSYDDGLFFERMVAEYTRSPESIARLHQFLDKSAPRVRPE